MAPTRSGRRQEQKAQSAFLSILTRSPFLPLILALSAVSILYWPILGYQFSIIDDGVNVFHNPYIGDPHAQNLQALWTRGYYALYMPLTDTIWALCARINPLPAAHAVPPGGANLSVLNPASFHAASLLLHLGVVALIFAIQRRLRIPAGPSAVGALFFGVHPVQVQSVAWITGMNNLTGGFFGLLGLWFYLLAVNDPQRHKPVSSRASSALYGFATLAFVAALLCKPTATIIPIFAAVFETVLFRRPIRSWIYHLGFWLLPAIGCAVINSIVAKHDNSAVWSPLWGRPFIVGDSLAFAFGKLVCPVSLTVDYGRSPHFVLSHAWGYLTWIVPALTFLAGRQIYRRLAPDSRRILLLSALLFVFGLLPTLGIVPYYTQWVSSVSDRYLYLALTGPAIGIGYLMSLPGPIRRIALPAVIVVLALFALQTKRELPIWRDMDTLTDSMLVESPDSWMAHGNEGYISGARGDLERALREFETADRLETPKTADNKFFVGITLTEMGRFNEAIEPLSAAFRLNPSDNEMTYQLWNALAYLKRFDAAQAVLERHIALRPDDGRAQLNMGKMWLLQHRPGEALPYLDAASRLLPVEPAAEFFLGTAEEQLGRTADALRHYERARDLDPSRPEVSAATERLRHGH